MSTLQEIEEAIPNLSSEEFAELENFIRVTKTLRDSGSRPSIRDIKPKSVGKMLKPWAGREELYDEMLGGVE